jgi:hypothetical protein
MRGLCYHGYGFLMTTGSATFAGAGKIAFGISNWHSIVCPFLTRTSKLLPTLSTLRTFHFGTRLPKLSRMRRTPTSLCNSAVQGVVGRVSSRPPPIRSLRRSDPTLSEFPGVWEELTNLHFNPTEPNASENRPETKENHPGQIAERCHPGARFLEQV